MAYFNYSGDQTPFTHYPFDFHSHFSGILPLESEHRLSMEIKFRVDNNKTITLKRGQPLSLLWLMHYDNQTEDFLNIFSEDCAAKRKELETSAHYKLFALALKLMEEKNPFALADYTHYQRGECAAESIYFASVLLLANIGIFKRYPIGSSDIYRVTRRLLENGTLKTPDNALIVRYFNKKIYSANKYTPFDDAYWARDAVRDSEFKNAFNAITLEYMAASGVQYAQIAASTNGVIELDNQINLNDGRPYKGYKLLAHTAHAYSDEKNFESDLKKIHELFKKGNTSQLVGIDLLGVESQKGLYQQFFNYLLKFPDDFKPTHSKKTILHIHCGEGSGEADNNRSLCGYYFRNRVNSGTEEEFYKLLYRYLVTCYHNAQRVNTPRSASELPPSTKLHVSLSSLFDELFHYNSLISENLRSMRFDITSPIGQSQVAYSAKSNIAHLIEVLDENVSGDAQNTYYQRLTNGASKFSIRIGHAYQARNLLSRKFPELYFDTNLGSNFITGAAAIYDSAQIYRLNKGFRHLDGQIDTNLLQRVINAIAYSGEQSFSSVKLQKVRAFIKKIDSMEDDKIAEVIAKDIKQYKGEFKELIPIVADIFIKIRGIRIQDGDTILLSKQKDLLYAIFSLFHNWRSLILGADGQGVEHTDLQKESARMALLQSYNILHTGFPKLMETVIPLISNLIFSVSKIYWENTIGKIDYNEHKSDLKLIKFEGFKSPESVVYIKTEFDKPSKPAQQNVIENTEGEEDDDE